MVDIRIRISFTTEEVEALFRATGYVNSIVPLVGADAIGLGDEYLAPLQGAIGKIHEVTDHD